MKRVSELSALSGFFSGRFSTAIQQINHPIHQGRPKPFHGCFFIVGSIPAACYDSEHGKSKIYLTLAECRKAIESAGVERYQLPDCSWNKE